jgi:prephenate dehydratase
MKIAIQGYEACYHQEAAEHFTRGSIECVPCRNFRELVKTAVDDREVDGAIMAIENSIAGSIIPNYNLLMESGLKITGEIYFQIRHKLMVLPGQPLDAIREVHSHPMAIEQCRRWFDDHRDIQLVETEDTALSARRLAESRWLHVGAIANQRSADRYGLEVIAENIETVRNNYTRFLILSREYALDGAGANKASVHFRVSHHPGSLQKALNTLARHDINLSKIQSFPTIEKEWQYYFHCDLEFAERGKLENALEELKGDTEMLRILGIYKKGLTV